MARAPNHDPGKQFAQGNLNEKEFLNKSVANYDLECPYCFHWMEEPVQTSCGHRFCKHCLEAHFARNRATGQELTCISCREVLTGEMIDVFYDKAFERTILSSQTTCPNNGCYWTGEQRNKEDHIQQCKFSATLTRERDSSHEENAHLLASIDCRYLDFGCKAKIKPDKMEHHLQSTKDHHLDLACAKTKEIEKQLREIEAKLKSKTFPFRCSLL